MGGDALGGKAPPSGRWVGGLAQRGAGYEPAQTSYAGATIGSKQVLGSYPKESSQYAIGAQGLLPRRPSVCVDSLGERGHPSFRWVGLLAQRGAGFEPSQTSYAAANIGSQQMLRSYPKDIPQSPIDAQHPSPRLATAYPDSTLG